MTKLVTLLAIIGIITFFVEILRSSKKQDDKKSIYSYTRKNFFLSRAEHECYDALVKAVGDTYYVFPQVHLPTIVDNKVVGQNWRGAFKHINEKSVDFVLCDKAYIAPRLVIELDDHTHKRSDRIERDKEVERILGGAGLPLLRLENHGQFDPQMLSEKVSSALGQEKK